MAPAQPKEGTAQRGRKPAGALLPSGPAAQVGPPSEGLSAAGHQEKVLVNAGHPRPRRSEHASLLP